MGLNGVEAELGHVTVENGSEVNKVNGGLVSEPIKFGSHGSDEPTREANNNPESKFPKDAADEWPEPKQVHAFYIVKYRSIDDQKLKAKLDQADKDVQRLNQARGQIIEKLRAKRDVRGQVMTQIRSLSGETKQYNMIMDEKRKEMEPLTQALGTLRGPNNRDRGFVCSSEEELNQLIKSLQYRIQHESIPLTEEKQILRDIKQLEGTREQVIAKAAVRAKIQVSLGEKEAIQDQVKLIGGDLDGVRKERQAVRDKLKQLDNEKEAIDKEIDSLQDELTIVTEKREKAYEKIHELRKQREEGNTPFYQNRTLLIKARELAAKKDVEALRELSDVEAGKFIAMWSSSKAFRDDYEKRILASLDIRQLSKDGRMRNPGEKPLVAAQEVPAPPAEPEVVLAKPKAKQVKEELVPPPLNNAATTQKAQKEKNSKPEKEIKGAELEDTEEVYGLKKVEKDVPKRTEVDEKKLKEMKREEEAAKAKQALERKKKLAEKAAAKAAIKAQKEAEKKIKEREKKAKKKQQSSAPEQEEATEATEEVTEGEKAVDETVEVSSVPSKIKERKENTIIRQRGRAKGPQSISKVILKRKKSTNYMVWAAPAAAAACVLALLVIGYNSYL